MELDETVYVEAGAGAKNLKFEDEKRQARFELAVSMMIYKWDDLEIAVENGWGGPESPEKRDWLTAVIVDLFKDGKIVDAVLIEETMLYAMIDEFDTNVEDDSALPIAVGIINRYKECAKGDYSVLEELYVNWQQKQDHPRNVKAVVIEKDPLNPESEEEAGEEEEEEEEVEVEVEVEERVGGGQNASAAERIVDEDGFELVQKKGGRR